MRHHTVRSRLLPPAFDGYTLLQISDLHVDISPDAVRRAAGLLPGLRYDACVLTGDYRGATFGSYQAAVDGVAQLRPLLQGPVFAVLGNHDTVRMVPAIEALDIRVLLNECQPLAKDGGVIYLAGIDDAHFFRADNIEKAGDLIPEEAFAILLSHTPEIYRQAAHAGFHLMLSGHTHGGQICLPGGIPLTLDSRMPRRYGAGAWTYHGMAGYTSVGVGCSVVAARLNCLPEITLHHLHTAFQ